MRTRGTSTRRALVALLALTAVAVIAAAFDRPGSPRRSAPGPTLGTPLWSARRAPQPVVDAVGAQHLQRDLQATAGGNGACFEVQSLRATMPIAGLETESPLIPASTMKLLTAVAALDALGQDFRFTTRAVAPGPVRDATVDRVFLVGGGDPLLVTPEREVADESDPETAGLASTSLATLADRIVAAGVRTVPNGVVGVDDRYDTTRYLDAWPAAVRGAIGPVGALTVNDGRAGPAGSGPATDDPARNAAAELTRLLADRGVQVGAPSRSDGAPDGTLVASIDSAALPLVLTEMLSASDNLTAEMLVRELGSTAGTATTERGVQTVRDRLGALGVDLTDATIVDGSGLARENRLRCTTLLDVLDLTGRRRFAPVRDGLAVAGERGTLATRLRGTPLAGKLRAKTGTLSGVSGLAGFVDVGRPLSFALLLGGDFGEARAFELREAMATVISHFPTVADPATVVPTPKGPIPPRACPGAEGAC